MDGGGLAVAPSRRRCDRLGCAATDWRRGSNAGPQGNVDERLAQLAAHTADMLAPSPVPTTSIDSRSGGTVAWQTCRDDLRAGAPTSTEDIEVKGSHLGMACNSGVMHIVADRLAQPVGDWRPYAMGASLRTSSTGEQ